MQINPLVNRAHDLVEPLQEFANSLRSGCIKEWKACGILVQIAQSREYYTSEKIEDLVVNSLEMEGFRRDDCATIAIWIERRLK